LWAINNTNLSIIGGILTMDRKPPGFWKIEQNAYECLAQYVNELGYIPSLPELKKLNSSLARAINRYYSMKDVYGWFEYEFKERKPSGFWLDKENIENRFKGIVNELGYIPSATELIELGHQDLVSALSRHKYNLTEIREWFGMEDQNREDRNQYKDIQLVFEEVKEFVQSFDGIPTIEDLRSNGKHYLVKAMYETHKISYSLILDILGVGRNKMANGYWHSEVVIIMTAKQIISEYGFLPSQRALAKEKKYQSFCNAVCKHNEGFHKLREDLGLTQLKKEKGFWQNEEELLNDLEKVIEIYGHIPTYLHKKGYGYLESALQYYGGVFVFAYKHNLPLENTRVPYTHFDDEERLENKVRELINKFGDFPSYTELVHHREYAVINRLCNKYGSIAEASIAYGYRGKVIQSIDGHLCDSFQERIIDDYLMGVNVPHLRGIELQLGEVCVVPDFILSVVPDIILPVVTVIEVLMYDYRLPIESEKQAAYVTRYLIKREAYIKHNITLIEVFPDDLKSKEILDKKLYNLVKKFANSPFKDLSNVPLSSKTKRPPGYWMLFKNVKKELLPICLELGRFPTNSELKERDLLHIGTICRNYHDGLDEVAKKLGYSRKKRSKIS
jgi:hypothetical protein